MQARALCGFVFAAMFWSSPATGLETDARDHRIAIGLGSHDVIDQEPLTGIGLLEYRACCRWYTLRPAAGMLVDALGAFYVYGGIRSELESSRRPFMFSINTAIGYYRRGGGTMLGHKLEFRSGFEIYYVFANESRLGTTFHHLSNASIGRRNPGTEVFLLIYDFPVAYHSF